MREEELADGVKLILGDNRKILPTIKDIDHIISDPPYEDELHAAVGKINRIRTDGRRVPEEIGFAGINKDRAEYAKLLTEASRGWVMIFTLAEGVRAWRDDLQAAGLKYDTCLAWIKPDASPRFNGQGAARGFECVVTGWAGTGYRSWNAGGKRGVYTHCINTSRYSQHTCSKPVSLMCELVLDFTRHGQLICDPFMGGGATGAACIRLGRRFLGIERDEKFFEMALKNLSAELKQADLFINIPRAKQQVFDLCPPTRPSPTASRTNSLSLGRSWQMEKPCLL